MASRAVGGLVGALLLTLAVPAAAPAELAFYSERCDPGGVRQYGPGGPVEGICRYGIFRMADDGSGVQRLTNGLSPGEAEDAKPSADILPAWSPTGAEIVFQRQSQEADSGTRLFVVTANGTAQRRLIPNPGLVRAERNPAWSPLGTHIAFGGYEEIPGEDIPFVGIFTVRADGSDVRRVSVAGRGADYPVFMPDGRLVFYERSTPGPKFPGFHTEPDRGLVATNVAGTEVVPITFGEATPTFFGDLAFSPDGRYLATNTRLMGNLDGRIWIMRLDTGELWPATEGPVGSSGSRPANFPAFSIRGPALFYNDTADGGRVKRVALRAGATPATVVEGRYYGLEWSLLGGVLPPIPTDAPRPHAGRPAPRGARGAAPRRGRPVRGAEPDPVLRDRLLRHRPRRRRGRPEGERRLPLPPALAQAECTAFLLEAELRAREERRELAPADGEAPGRQVPGPVPRDRRARQPDALPARRDREAEVRRGLVAGAALLVVLALPAAASAQGAVAFSSLRCDQGGQAWNGSRPPSTPSHCARGIFVVGDDGTLLKRLSDGAAPGEEARSGDFSPSWSPNGQRIVFARQTNEGYGRTRLFTMRANGSDQRRLIPSPPPEYGDEHQPAWSPTADLIVFTSPDLATCFRSAISRVASDGTGLRKLGPAGHQQYAPTFTPDGRRVVYYGGPFSCGPGQPQTPPPDHGMWMVDVDGANPQRLTAGDIRIAANGLSFSPDGERMAVTLADGSLYTIRTDGSELTRLTTGLALDPDWSGAGNAIFFQTGTNAYDTAIHRLTLPAVAPPVALTAPGVGDGEPDWSLAGRVTSLLPLDDLPPIALIGDLLGVPPASSGSVRKAASPGLATSRLPFIVVDRTGIRRVEAALGLRVKGGCRFTDGKALGRRRSCSSPVYVRVKSAGGWEKLTRRLPKGKYHVRFRTTDVRGNSTKRPKPRVVRLK